MTADLMARATRRQVLVAGAGLASIALLRPARADVPAMESAIHEFVGKAKVSRGKVHLDIPPLVENGNAAPVTLTVDSPMTPKDFVKAIALFNEKNPQPNVAVFHIGPRAGRAQVSTRMRLATSQKITAIAALSDGTFWSDSADVIVTLAACIEG